MSKVAKSGLAVLALAALVLPDMGWAACRQAGGVLDKTLATTLQAVRNNDSKTFLSLVSPEGMSFEQSPAMSLDALSADFANKGAAYCDLFVCGGKAGGLHALLLGPTVKKQVLNNDHAVFADVTIGRGRRVDIQINYQRTNTCQWQIIWIGTP